MAEVATVVGLVASIIQLVKFISPIIRRLDGFQGGGQETPKTFQDLKTELPVLQEILQQIDKTIDADFVGDETETVLLSAVKGCRDKIQKLNTIMTRTLPSSDDSSQTRLKKTVASLYQESKVKSMMETLDRHIWRLTLCHAVATTRNLPGTALLVLLVEYILMYALRGKICEHSSTTICAESTLQLRESAKATASWYRSVVS